MHQKFGIVAVYSWVKAACRALVYFFYYKQYFEKKLSFFFKMDPLVALLFGPRGRKTKRDAPKVWYRRTLQLGKGRMSGACVLFLL